MLTYLGIAERFKPRWLVWENVPGVLSSNGGKDFGSFLGALGELGYEWAYRVLDAQWFGVAQRRRRVFVVAHLGKGNFAAKVLFESESVRRDTPPSREARQGVATDVEASVGSGKWPADIASTLNAAFGSKQGLEDQHALGGAPLFVPGVICASDGQANASINHDIAPTLTKQTEQPYVYTPSSHAGYKEGVGTLRSNGGDLGGGSENLCLAIAIHDQATRHSGKHGDKQDGKGNGLGVGKPGDPAPTLTKGDKHAIAFSFDSLSSNSMKSKNPISGCNQVDLARSLDTSRGLDPTCNQGGMAVLYENHPNDSRVTGPHDVAPSCVSRYGTDGGNVPLVQEAIVFQTSELRLTGKITEQTVCPTLKANTKAGDTEPKVIAFKPGIATREGNESRFVKELSPTLRKEMGDNQVAVAVDIYNQALGVKSQTLRSGASSIEHSGGVINPADRMAVRRLSPRECERLQGFNDDHTLIPWRNKPADQCPDGPRYKALGNSMAVPCMAWIGKRIARVENERQGVV
jgi:DNA (cytosine-5)-methyltransferase 1